MGPILQAVVIFSLCTGVAFSLPVPEKDDDAGIDVPRPPASGIRLSPALQPYEGQYHAIPTQADLKVMEKKGTVKENKKSSNDKKKMPVTKKKVEGEKNKDKALPKTDNTSDGGLLPAPSRVLTPPVYEFEDNPFTGQQEPAEERLAIDLYLSPPIHEFSRGPTSPEAMTAGDDVMSRTPPRELQPPSRAYYVE